MFPLFGLEEILGDMKIEILLTIFHKLTAKKCIAT